MTARGHGAGRDVRPVADVPPRFRCLVCRRFVTGGVDGTCPRCGWRPPTARPQPPRRRVAPAPAWAVVVGLAVAAGLAAWMARALGAV